MRRLNSVVVLSSVVGLAGAASGQCEASKQACGEKQAVLTNAAYTPPGQKSDIVDTAITAGSFKTLAAALHAAGLVETLKGKGPFTVFAPTDEAFAKLPKGTLENLLKPESKAMLTSILTYHVVPGSVMAKDVTKLTYAGTINGQRTDISIKDSGVMLDGRARVTSTDIACSNGVIHVIDTVIMPVSKNALEVAGEAGSFKTLLAAIDAAGLSDALRGPGPFTILAPSDDAFSKLPKGTLESLLKPENKEQLASILKFHVIPARAYASDVVKMRESAKTLQGGAFMVRADETSVRIGNDKAMATIVATDIEASNAVIHVIDSVLMPK
jgi:transforming growth factor-beta-induced protein